jgi:PAS domain S-box-containing protein
VKTRTQAAISLTQLTHLPSFAAYLLDQRLDDFVRTQLHLSEEIDLPIMRFFKHYSPEELFAIARKGAADYLSFLSRNEAEQQIAQAVRQWKENQLPLIKKHEVAAEDITLVSYLRKQTFLHFIQDYCPNIGAAVELLREIDFFVMTSETAMTNTYIQLLKEKISENSLLIEKVTQTIPGAVYVFDVDQYKGVYSNNKLGEIIGYGQDELNELAEGAIPTLLHEEDREGFTRHLEELKETRDGETRTFKYRIKDRDGKYRWLSSYESVFKRDEQGRVVQTIGITLDVDQEQKVSEALRENENLYRQAEAITHLGNYTWDLTTKDLKWSNELYRMYGLEPQSQKMTSAFIKRFNHPDDDQMVEASVQRSLEERTPFDFHYRIILHNGTQKILHARGNLIPDASGVPAHILGTVLDVTERQNLIDRLKQSEAVYKQAEALANMGNWSWDLKSGHLEWTDQLYRIYGLEPQSEELNIDRFLSFVHPDDREYVKGGTGDDFEDNILDYTFRIITTEGRTKVLRSVAQVYRDENGKAIRIVGTERDITEKQNLIARLQESEKLSKQAQSLARLGNWTLNVKSEEFLWSDEMYNIYELDTSEQMDFEKWLGFLPAEDRKSMLDYYQQCLRDKKTYDRIHRIVLRNGKIKTIHRKAEFICDENGVPVKMIGTTQDVTEEHRVQQELKDNQTFIRKIADATPSIIASYNVNTGKYVFISEGLEKLLGYHRLHVMEHGVNFLMEIIHPDDIGPMMEKNAKAIQEVNEHPQKNDLVIEFTYRMRHSNGHYRWFHTYGTIFDRNAEGQVEHVLNISLDVTDQVGALEKIKEQEHFIQQIADASPTILYLYNVETQSIQYINREIFFVLGYQSDEIIDAGEHVTETLYHPEDHHLLPGRRQSTKTFQQVDSMIQYECRMKNKDDEWRWLLVREIVFKTDEEGNILQILGAALDINRRKEMEKTILQNTMLLEQSNASLEEFAYVASHDLKEPLRKISTFGDRLVTTQLNNLAPDGKIYLQKIVDASQRMQIMINDLLSISMITGNTAFEKFSLAAIFEETLQTLEHKIEQQNAIITSDVLPEAKIIASQFRQLFQNLLSNSLKFVRPGVQPRIRVGYRLLGAQDMTHYQLAPAEHYHELTFSDNGIGFEIEFAGKIFAIFQRLHGRSEYEGSGIGLAICKKIVEHHGGIIYATGIPDEGATFTIILPAR